MMASRGSESEPGEGGPFSTFATSSAAGLHGASPPDVLDEEPWYISRPRDVDEQGPPERCDWCWR